MEVRQHPGVHFAVDDVGPGWDVVRGARAIQRRADVSLTGFRQREPQCLDMRPRALPAVTVVVSLGADALSVGTIGTEIETRRFAGGMVPGITHIRGRDVDCVEMRMSPLAAFTLLDGSSADLNGAPIGLDDLWGRDAVRLCERLACLTGWVDRFAAVETVLGDRLSSGPAPDPEVRYVWARILNSAGSTRVDRLAAECGWSYKRLWARFRTQVGLPPKRAARLVRFDAAARRLSAGADVAAVAADGGYADQAHLHRDVRDFTGWTPGQLAGGTPTA